MSWRLVLLCLALLPSASGTDVEEFTQCDENCEQTQSAGNVTIRVLRATNLPDLDGWGAAGAETDAFVKLYIDGDKRQTPVVPNSLDPVWNGGAGSPVTFDVRAAGSVMSFELWDKDSGLEFGDDLISSASALVPFCSVFSAPTVRESCGLSVCSSDGSSWAMSTHQECEETAWLVLGGAAASTDPADCWAEGSTLPCMQVQVNVVPFQVDIEWEHPFSGSGFNVTVAGTYPASDDFSSHWGKPYTSSNTYRLNAEYPFFQDAKGGLMVRTSNSNNTMWGSNDYAIISLNFPAKLFLFTYSESPVDIAKPAWMASWDTDTIVKAQLTDQGGNSQPIFDGAFKSFGATTKNKYGEVLSGEIVLGMPARDPDNWFLYNFFLVALPVVVNDAVAVEYSKTFDRGEFVRASFTFGIPLVFWGWLAACYVRKLGFNLDRIPSQLMQLELEGKRRNVVAALFSGYGETKDNEEVRRNLYYATKMVEIFLALPVLLMWVWGLVCVTTVNPPSVGFGICFIGQAAVMTWFAFNRWRVQGWRMDGECLSLFWGSFVCVLAFLVCTVFVDPAVYEGGEDLEFFAVSCVFLTINLLPIIWLSFTNNKELQSSLTQLVAVASASKKKAKVVNRFKAMGAMGLKLGMAVGAEKAKKATKAKAAERVPEPSKHKFHRFLGETCTIVSDVPSFGYADILVNMFTATATKRKETNKRLYQSSLVVLFIYSIIGAAGAGAGGLGFGNAFSVVYADWVAYMLRRGHIEWRPGYTVGILGGVRACIAMGGAELWLVGYSFGFVVIGLALTYEVIRKRLPRISAHEAGSVAFFGQDTRPPRVLDLSGTPEFLLGLTCFLFVLMLLAVVFSTDEFPTISVMGQEWESWIFGVLSFLVVIVAATTWSTSRAFFLQKQRLLDLRSAAIYLFHRKIRLPAMLAIAAEMSILCSGMLLFASTGSSLVFTTSVFGPPLLLVGGAVYRRWVKNGYRIVVWPPEESLDDDEDDAEEMGRHGEETKEPGEDESRRPSLAAAEFTLPPLVKSDPDSTFMIKMPALPLKSSLAALKNEEDGGADTEGDEDVVPVSDGEGSEGGDGADGAGQGNGGGDDDDDDDAEEEKKKKKRQAQQDADDDDDNEDGEGGGDGNKLQLLVGKLCPWRKYAAVRTETQEVLNDMTLFEAFRAGVLSPYDKKTLRLLGTFYFLVWLYGMIVMGTERPAVMGSAMWIGTFVVIHTLGPIVKYFNTFHWEREMTASVAVGSFLALITLIIVFTSGLNSNVNDVRSLFVLNLLVVWPALVVMGVILYKWRDDNWAWDKRFQRPLGVIMGLTVVFVFEAYIWGGAMLGGTLTLVLLVQLILTKFLRAWIKHDFFLPVAYQRAGIVLMHSVALLCLACGVMFDVNLYFAFSVGFLCMVGIEVLKVLSRKFTIDPGAPVFFAPFVLPVFSYNASTEMLECENETVGHMFRALGLLLAWGVCGAMFVDPIGFGIGVSCSVLIGTIILSAVLLARTPVRLGSAARFVNEAMLVQTGEAVVKAYHKRVKGEVVDIGDVKLSEEEERRAAEERDIQRIMGQVSTMDKAIAASRGDVENPLPTAAAELARLREDKEYSLHHVWKGGKTMQRRDALYAPVDVLFDIVSDQGPLAFMACGGLPKMYLMQNVKALNAKYGLDGHERANIDADGPEHDFRATLAELPNLDQALANAFWLELQSIIHLELLIMLATEARLRREGSLFQRYLRESRYRLMSSGINPPPNVFKTKSFASVDIPLVALWLQTLTPEERERFHLLKLNFSEEVEANDALVDAEDAKAQRRADEVRRFRRGREEEMCRLRYEEFHNRRQQRVAAGKAAHGGDDEALVNAREVLAEIHDGWSCQSAIAGRVSQFCDGEFTPDVSALGHCHGADQVSGWRSAREINVSSQLFTGGTDPDDVYPGLADTGYFLSALSILAASGGVDDDKVDPLIDRLFITKTTSVVGAYAVRFHFNGQWETVFVDDFFPVIKRIEEIPPDAHDEFAAPTMVTKFHAAFGHSKNFNELWVPVLEKAYARYYGNYANIEGGFVHHALSNLTGAEAEEIFLAKMARGAHKSVLWNRLLRYKDNRYLMGARSVSAQTAGQHLQDSGLMFSSVYVIYDVRFIDGYRLLKLRNPPGDHAEWRGDWGDASRLWSRRLKHKLGWTAEDDNTFWMSYDDFCSCFASLFVCRYYDEERWHTSTLDGEWKGELAAGLPHSLNANCNVSNNPQFLLEVERPTDVCITVTQVDVNGLAHPDCFPVSIFIFRTGKRVPNFRDVELQASSGRPQVLRSVKCYATLPPGDYNIMVATFQPNMEGPFKIAVLGNYDAAFHQLWPPAWRENKVRNAQLAGFLNNIERVRAQVDSKRNKLVKSLEGMALEASGMAGEDGDGDGDVDQCWEERFHEKTKRVYWYNTATKAKTWDRPKGFDPTAAKKGPKQLCGVCSQEASEVEDLLVCSNKCGAKAHPTCVGLSKDISATEAKMWLCSMCA